MYGDGQTQRAQHTADQQKGAKSHNALFGLPHEIGDIVDELDSLYAQLLVAIVLAEGSSIEIGAGL
jgi:hypothetical protein